MAESALLVMDFQRSIVERFDSSAALDAAVRAVGAARDAGVPVLFVRVAFRDGFPEIAASNRTFSAVRERGPSGTEQHEQAQIHPAFERREREPLVTKRRVSAFTGSDLEVLLRGLGARHLVLAGIATSGVVLSTLRQAADLDFGLTVLADACTDADPEVHRVLTEKVFPRQATVTTVADWSAGLT
jgi:nicotinamidase-related amidase